MKVKILCATVAALLAGPVFAHTSGKAVYDQTCFTCHTSGLMNAPKLGDKEAWAPRIAKGKSVLYNSANYGFKAMPPHGGNDELTNKEIFMAVDYIVEQVGGYPDNK